MKDQPYSALLRFVRENTQLAELEQPLESAISQGKQETIASIYQQVFLLAEQQMWQQGTENRLTQYQNLFREAEQLVSPTEDKRHNFVIVIPVADRPEHLECCLNSILTLCQLYQYGGKTDGLYNKVSVIIADDSKAESNISADKNIAEKYTALGLNTEHFGQQQQLAQLAQLDKTTRTQLAAILGQHQANEFYHKGPSIMRNISYLKLKQVARTKPKTLFFFIDSDQEFQIKIADHGEDKNLYAINYFYYLDQIFSDGDISVLTGKVVGDPPVSPAVMALNFMDDVIAFLQEMTRYSADHNCQFHQHNEQNGQDAAYHDMANMFGFEQKKSSYQYRCTLRGKHTNKHCFNDFCSKLNRFFYGEHPTRITYFQYQNVIDSITPARTIYTGNYVLNEQGLKHFIPFATLRLRMAGPVLGRLIKADIGDQFVSANLPMLHKRTLNDSGTSEYRPGIEKTEQIVDLSDEFERQFFGDLMLFSMAKLSEKNYPDKAFSTIEINDILNQVETDLIQQYQQKHQTIKDRLSILQSEIDNPSLWWSQQASNARQQLIQFMRNIEHNFGDNAKGYRQINDSQHCLQRKQQITDAIIGFADDKNTWEQLLRQTP